jgi:hypothetical protein
MKADKVTLNKDPQNAAEKMSKAKVRLRRNPQKAGEDRAQIGRLITWLLILSFLKKRNSVVSFLHSVRQQLVVINKHQLPM